MLIRTVANLRRLLMAIWLLSLAGLIGLAVFSHLGMTFIIRGASMGSAVPIGSLVSESQVAVRAIRPGDVVTIKTDNGLVLTHRVTRVVDLADGRFFELKGDANAAPDPALVPGRALVGRVSMVVPRAGYLAAMLATPAGLSSLLAFLAAGLLAVWLVEELETELEDARDARIRRGGRHAEETRRGALA